MRLSINCLHEGTHIISDFNTEAIPISFGAARLQHEHQKRVGVFAHAPHDLPLIEDRLFASLECASHGFVFKRINARFQRLHPVHFKL